jgi:hypothetical protein
MIYVGGMSYLASGGMCYGDPPTESYAEIEMLGSCQVAMELLEQLCREEKRESVVEASPWGYSS